MRIPEGGIYKRGKRWYGRFTFQGKAHWVALRDDDGLPVAGERAAKAALERLVAPFRLRSLEQRAAALAAEAQTLRARLEKAEFRGASCAQLWPWYAAEKLPELRGALPGSKTRAYLFYRYSVHFAAWADANGVGVAGVDAETARRYFAELSVTPASRNDRLRWFRMLFKALMRAGKVPQKENPFAALDAVRTTTHAKRALDAEQVRALFAAAEGETRRLFAIGFYAGLRLGDAATLRWGEVDLRRGIIERVQRKTARRARSTEDATAKIGVNAELAAELGRPGEGYVLPKTAEQYLRNPRVINDRVRAVFEAAGLRNERRRPDGRLIVEYGFHSLRHTAISMAANAGVPALVAQKMAGHASQAMTAHYAHLDDAAAKAAAEKLKLGKKK